MADNTTSAAGPTIATDDIGGAHYQRVKLTWGADGTATDASAAAPVPVAQTGALPAGANNIGDVDIVGGATAHDAAATAVNPVLVGGYASAAAPTAVSADGDAVRLWQLRNGALAVNITAAGALIPGDASFGLDVDVARLPALVAGSALVGDVANALRATANGLTSSRVASAATTNATSLKASAGRIARIDVFNTAVSIRFLKLYNKASAPTVGTDTPVWTIPLPAGSGFSSDFIFGKSFSLGIAYAITAAQADADTTAVAAGDVTGSIDWI